MYFYNVLPTKNMGQNLSILLYSSQKQASVGDIVEITIRNNIDFGLILSENVEERIKWQNSIDNGFLSVIEGVKTLPDRILNQVRNDNSFSNVNLDDIKNTKSEVLSKKFEIKEINKTLPIKLTHEQIQFIKIFADNTFNSLNDTWDAITQSFGLLTQKQWKELQEIANSSEKAILNQIQSNQTNPNTSPDKIKKAHNDTYIEAKNSENLKNTEKVLNFRKEEQKTPKVEFIIDFDIIVRIMYIIRSLTSLIDNDKKVEKQRINRQLLVVFPEKKYLNKVYKSIFNEILSTKELSEIVELLYYASEPTKKPKECVWSMINFRENKLDNCRVVEESLEKNKTIPGGNFCFTQDEDNSTVVNQTSQNVNNSYVIPKLQVILSTRSGIFLPFTALTDIILVDEGNSMYIQDQNSLYYDTREAIFLMSKALNANISFISPLPSIRLYNMYDKEVLEKQMIKYSDMIQKPRKIKITKFDKKSSKYNLFGYEIEQILEGLNS